MYATAEPYLTYNSPITHTKSIFHPYRVSESEKYIIAQVARQKLLVESSFRDHDLRRMVGHANLVDTYLTEHLAKREEKTYEVMHVETAEEKQSQHVEHVCEYILQEQTSRNEDREPGKKTYASLTVPKDVDTMRREDRGIENHPVQVTVDFAEVEIDEKEVSEDDD